MVPKAQLMMIDDDPSVLETFRLWLEDEGYLLHTASSKAEALNVIQHHPISVCLIDLKIEDENGLQVGKELAKVDSLLKSIIVTGFPSYETAIDAMRMGIFDYASKSSENRDILKKIEDAIHVRNDEIETKGVADEDTRNIILICHHMMIREGFENLFRDYPKFRLTHTYHSLDYIKPGDFNSKAALVLMCNTCNPDLVKHPDENIPPLRVYFPSAALVMFNCSPSDETKKKLVKMGIKGFLPKNLSKENMKKAFNTVLKGQIWVSRKVAHELLNEFLERSAPHRYVEPQNPYNLSNREIEILQAIASGLSNCEISNKLFISEKTGKAHIHHLFKKMNVKSRTKAVKKAVEDHII
jgi:DNA-binding NarL/FixJ family response regulator